MGDELIHNRGRGPEIVGTRTTVYQLLPYFLDPDVTEAYIAKLYDLSVEQAAAARAYVLNNADTVLANPSCSSIWTGDSPHPRVGQGWLIDVAALAAPRSLRLRSAVV